jgi:hypothetical protein
MKNAIWIGCMVTMMAGSSLLRASSDQILRISDLNEETIQEFSNGNRSDYILECSEGVAMPFKLAINGEFLALEQSAAAPYHLKVLKTCYVRCEEQGNFLFSTDLQTWKGFSDFFTGKLNVSVGIENKEPAAALQLELNQRNG